MATEQVLEIISPIVATVVAGSYAWMFKKIVGNLEQTDKRLEQNDLRAEGFKV